MGVERLFRRSDPVVFLEIRELAPSCRPARLCRAYGMTLVALDPRGTCFEITDWMVNNLTIDEQAVVRAAYGQPPPGEYLEDWMVSDTQLAFLYVPPELRLTGALPLQGGRELARRRRLGLIEMEKSALRQELRLSMAQGA